MKLRYALCLAAACLMIAPVAASAVVIDSFSNSLPPNPDLPLSGHPILFMGTRCDGGACPPNPLVTHTGTDVADQTGLSGVLGGNRKTTLTEVSGSCNVNIVGSFGAATFNHDAGATKGIMDLDYGETVDLNADLTPVAATGIEIEIAGDQDDSNPVRPIYCTVTATSGRGTPGEATDSHQLILISDGVHLFTFASFSGVDFTDVDRLQVRFETSQQFGAVDFVIYPIRTNETPVPVQLTSWGALKTRHE
jgi:hypothetical protein